MSIYAIIESGGKQYRVEEGDVIDVELLGDNSKEKVEFKVLFLNNGKTIKIGNPHLGGAAVRGDLIQEVKGPKVVAFKYKERKAIRRKVGHRQRYSQVKITDIVEKA